MKERTNNHVDGILYEQNSEYTKLIIICISSIPINVLLNY